MVVVALLTLPPAGLRRPSLPPLPLTSPAHSPVLLFEGGEILHGFLFLGQDWAGQDIEQGRVGEGREVFGKGIEQGK